MATIDDISRIEAIAPRVVQETQRRSNLVDLRARRLDEFLSACGRRGCSSFAAPHDLQEKRNLRAVQLKIERFEKRHSKLLAQMAAEVGAIKQRLIGEAGRG